MPQAAPIIGNIALNLAIGYGASVLSSIIAPAPKKLKTTSRGMSFELSIGEAVPVSACVGLARTGGHLIFGQEYGSKNQYAKFVIICGRGWHDGLQAFLVDEKVCTLSGSNDDAHGMVVDRYKVNGSNEPSPTGTPHLWVKIYNGAPGQVADPGLIAAVPARWTADHKATGCAYAVVTIRQNPDLFGSTLPRMGFIWRGLRQYDWRFDSSMPGGDGPQRWNDPATWTFSRNPVVIRWNYRRGYWINGVRVLGMGFSLHAQDLQYYTAAANLCDELIGGKARYEFGREIFDDEEALDVLADLDAAVCGFSFDRGGADAPLPAQQHVSVMTLEDKHLLKGHEVKKDRKGAVSLKRTAYHGSYVSAAEDWQPRPYPTRVSTVLEEAIGGRKLQPFNQPWECDPDRAQMRAEIELRKNLFGATRTETFGPRTNVLEPGDPFTRVMADWGTMLCIVESIQPLEGRVGNTITWREWSNTIVPASYGFAEVPVGPGASPSPADRTIAVSGLNVVPHSREGGGAVLPFARVTWTPITDPNVDQVMVRFWPSAGSEAVDALDFFASSKLTSALLAGPLQPDTVYAGFAIPIRSDGRLTVPTNPFELTTGALTVPAEVPPGSVGNLQLNKAIRDAINFVVGTGDGTVADLYERINDELDRLAGSVVTNTMASDRDRKAISVRVNDVQAAVVQEAIARADADNALSQFVLEVAAQAASGLAEGLFTVRAISGPEGAAVTLALLARVTTLEDYVETGIIISLFPDGVGGYDSKMIFKAESMFWTDGSTFVLPMVFEDGELKLNVANIGLVRAGRLESPDGKFVIDLNAKEWWIDFA